MYKTTKLKSIFGIVGRALSYLFFALCVFVLAVSITSKKDSDGAANLFGRQLRIVVSDSMAKCDQTDVSGYKIKDIPVKSLLFIELVPENEEKAQAWYGSLKKGDVLTFRYVYARQETITHRLVEDPAPVEGGYLLYMEGDNKASDSQTLTQTIDTSQTDSPNYVVGKVTGQSYVLGVLLTAMKSPVGIVCIVIIPCLLIMGLEIYRLISALTEKKRKAAKEKAQQQEEELQRLKAQLAALQAQEQVQTQAQEQKNLPPSPQKDSEQENIDE